MLVFWAEFLINHWDVSAFSRKKCLAWLWHDTGLFYGRSCAPGLIGFPTNSKPCSWREFSSLMEVVMAASMVAYETGCRIKSYHQAFLGVAPEVQKEVYEKTCKPNLAILKFFLSFPQIWQWFKWPSYGLSPFASGHLSYIEVLFYVLHCEYKGTTFVYAALQPSLQFTVFIDARSKPNLPVIHLIAISEVTVVCIWALCQHPARCR